MYEYGIATLYYLIYTYTYLGIHYLGAGGVGLGLRISTLVDGWHGMMVYFHFRFRFKGSAYLG